MDTTNQNNSPQEEALGLTNETTPELNANTANDTTLQSNDPAVLASDTPVIEHNKEIPSTGDTEPKVEPSVTAETELKEEVSPEKEKSANKRKRKAVKVELESEVKSRETSLKAEPVEEKKVVLPNIDYSCLGKEELVNAFKNLLENYAITHIKSDVETIKSSFYKKYKTELEDKKKRFVDEGGFIEEFEMSEDENEVAFKDLYKKYKELKNHHNEQVEKQKQKNLEEKYKIIEEIKELINKKESINQTFNEFRELQRKWRELGVVPQLNLKDLWETYNHHVEVFYNFIKINKELRDLDLKKNQDAKIVLCEKVEELILEPSINKATQLLQQYHDQWREIGPVLPEKKDEIWERFKEATRKVNKKHQDYFDRIREEQEKNHQAKSAICDKAEELAQLNVTNNREWGDRTKEMDELQKLWRTIGFAPKKVNNEVYQRFKNACDTFYGKKKEHFAHSKHEEENNLQFKTDICMQAEALQNSTEWKKTTEDFIKLQEKWKQTGPVSRKYSEEIWHRFRAACDTFFNNKQTYFASYDTLLDSNLKLKNELIEKIGQYVPSDNYHDNLNALKEFQKQFTDIGHVPMKDKDDVMKRFREAINKQFDNLNIDEHKRDVLKFKTRLENVVQEPNSQSKIRFERENILKSIKQLESDVVLLENNIGFFSKTKNAESIIGEVNKKIENARKNLKALQEKLNMLDKVHKPEYTEYKSEKPEKKDTWSSKRRH